MGFTEFGARDFKVVGIGGTLREGSANLGALKRAPSATEEAGAETELLDSRGLGLPMYEPGPALEEYGPGVERLVGTMRDADALIPSTGASHATLAGATNANGAMVDVVHALRGVVAPLMVAIPRSRQVTDGGGNVTDAGYGDRPGRLAAEPAGAAA